MAESDNPVTLVVDDNYFNRDLCRIALDHIGYEVVEAENGRQALDLLQDRTFPLLVIDLAMPEVDGLSVIREVRRQEQHRSMHIVAMTAHSHLATSEVSEIADLVMYKPIQIESFVVFLQRLKGAQSKAKTPGS